MHKATFIAGGLLIAALALLMVFSGGNNDQADALTPPLDDYFLCYNTTGGIVPPPQTVTNKFGNHFEVLKVADLYCEVSTKKLNKPTPTPQNPTLGDNNHPPIVCYGVNGGMNANEAVDLKTQFDALQQVVAQRAQDLCIEVQK